jgi:hypothetical protein
MKKIKLLTFAFAAVALASCSSDDLELANGESYQMATDGSEVFATINDGSEDVTRAGYATLYNQETKKFKQTVIFQKGDAFKMYCSDTWAPQLYAFKQDAKMDGVNDVTGAIFEYAGEAKYQRAAEGETREYGVYPAETFKFDDEFRTALKMELPAVDSWDKGGKYTAATTEIEGLTDRKVYNARVPLFGFRNDNAIEFNFMTGVIRIQLLGMKTGTHTLKLASAGTQLTGEAAVKYYQLSGEFTSTEFDATKGNTNNELPVFASKRVAAAADYQVSFTASETEHDFIIYMPIPVGTYQLDQLSLILDPAGENVDLTNDLTVIADNKKVSTYAAGDKITVKKGYTMYTSYEVDEVGTIANLNDLNSYLTLYADYGRDVTATLKLSADFEVPTDANFIEKAKKVVIPELKNNVTLKIYGETAAKTISTAVGKTLDFIDEGSVGTGKLTILLGDYAEVTADVQYNSGHNIEFGQYTATANTGSFTKLTFNSAVDVTLSGELDAAPTFTETDGDAPVKSLTIAADPKQSITAYDIPVTITSGIAADKTVTVTTGDVTVDAVDATINNITKTKGGNIAVNNGIVSALVFTGKPKDDVVAVTSKGKSAIKVVTGTADQLSKVTFNSTWDATAAAVTAVDIDGGNIYTAAQLAAATAATAYTLKTNVTINKAWTSPVLGGNFTATGYTISNLNAPLFGKITADVTIDGVTVQNANIVSTDEANGIGIIAKETTGTSSIVNTTVGGTVTGPYYVGGLVGLVSDGTLTIGASNTEAGKKPVTSTATFSNNKTYGQVGWDMKAGTFGQFVGSVSGTAKLDIKADATADAAFDKSLSGLKFSYNRQNNGTGTITGYFKGDSKLVGYTTTGANNAVTINGKVYQKQATLAGLDYTGLTYTVSSNKITGELYMMNQTDVQSPTNLTNALKDALRDATFKDAATIAVGKKATVDFSGINIHILNDYVDAENDVK